MSLVASVCQPSTLRRLICPEASNAQNNMAAVSASFGQPRHHLTLMMWSEGAGWWNVPQDFSSRGRSMTILGSGQPLRSRCTTIGIRAISLGGFGSYYAMLTIPDVPGYDGRKPLKVRLCLIEGSNAARPWC